MSAGPLLSRLASVLLGILGAAGCAVAVVLLLFWMMDQSGPTSSASLLLGAILAGALGAGLLVASRAVSPGRASSADDPPLARDELA